MPKKFSFTYYDKKHLRSLVKRALDVQGILDKAAIEGARIGQTTGFNDPDAEFHFSDFPAIKQRVDDLLSALHSRLLSTIEQGNEDSWRLSTSKNDGLVDLISSTTTIAPEQLEQWKRPNLTALAAFQGRKVAGMNLSERVWNLTGQFKSELELALEMGLGEGKSAADLSRDVRQYLNEPNKLFRRVRDAKGNLRLSKAAAAYHPGVGVYRSSYKNALRLTATENNMAYRTADYERWQQLDFVVGIVIKLSNNHPVMDICDELAGTYPKTFKFVGWHPWCRCIVIPKLSDESEFIDNLNSDDFESEEFEYSGVVTEPPAKFNQWCEDNKGRIRNGVNLPYFVKDNRAMVEGIIKGKVPEPTLTPDQARRARLAKRDDADIQRRWDERNRTQIRELLANVPGVGWHTDISGKLADQLRMLIDNYAIIHGNGILEDNIRRALDRGTMTTPEIRSRVSLYKKMLKSSNERMDMLGRIHSTDIDAFPSSWLIGYKKCIQQAGTFQVRDILHYYKGLNVTKDEAFRAIMQAENMCKLSRDQRAIDYGLSQLSPKTPVELFERFVAADKELAKAMPSKDFFDGLKHFVPLEKLSDGAHCSFVWPPIVRISDERRFKTISGLRNVIVHEYGHAYDRMSVSEYAKIWSNSDTELRKEYDALKPIITDKWRENAKKVLDEAYNSIKSNLTQKEIDLIEKTYQDSVDKLLNDYVSGKKTWKQYCAENERYEIERDRKLGVLEPRAQLREIRMTLSDIVEALDSAHVSLGYGGHGKKYWSESPNNDLCEFIAECSEARRIDYSVLAKAAPEIYKLMLKYGKKYWP